MESAKKEVLKELFDNLYAKENRENIELMILKLKSKLENLAGVNAFVTARVKSPISIIRKFDDEAEGYAEKWNNMRDLVGLMVVVDKNSDIDDIIFHLQNEYSDKKNPNQSRLFKDYRVINIRKDQTDKQTEKAADYDPPTDKGYQVCDGYKNVKFNMMIDGYPIEIQIKTKEQYVAHEATHDPVYKAPSVSNPKIRQMISDKLFPSFETHAHYMLHQDEMSDREKELWLEDMKKIEQRNSDVYEKYIDIYEDASHVYAFYLFMVKNIKQIYKDAAFGNDAINLKLLEIEVKRTFHYIEKEIANENPSLMSGEVFGLALEKLFNMPYEEFCQMRSSIAGSYRCEKCVVSGVYDLLRGKDVELIKRLSESFRSVEVAVFDDELAECFAGKSPLFSLKERQSSLRNIKGVSAVQTADITGKMSPADSMKFMTLSSQMTKKKYKVHVLAGDTERKTALPGKIAKQLDVEENEFEIGYLPGVFDMLHPENIEYIGQVCRMCKKVYVGTKSDQYVRIIKGEEPVLDFDERMQILKSLRGIADVVKTEFDITPPEEIFDQMQQQIGNGKKCAVFLGTSWVDSPDLKNSYSLREFANLARSSDIKLVTVPRTEKDRAGVRYKDRATQMKDTETNPYEFTIFDR